MALLIVVIICAVLPPLEFGEGPSFPLQRICWDEGKDAGLRFSRRFNGDKTGRDTLRPIRRQTKTHDEIIPPCGLVQHGGPRVNQPIVTGPAWPLRVTSLICKGIPVITVCNPALWEYSRDNLGV
jgi:hypothetical protein